MNSVSEQDKGLREKEIEQREQANDRERDSSECALGFFRYNGPGAIDYYAFASKLQQTQGAYRGGGGSGSVINAMTREKAMSILSSPKSRPRAIQTHGLTHRVNLADAKQLEVIQMHAQGSSVDEILRSVASTGVKPLYVESIGTNPAAMAFRTFWDTYGDIDPQQIADTYLRIFVDNPIGEDAVALEQKFQTALPGPVVMSWSSISDESPGLLCYKIAGRRNEFDEFFRPDFEEMLATEFLLHDRYPTQRSKPGVRNAQPFVLNHTAGAHNGDKMNSFIGKQRLRDPTIHKYEQIFFKRYGSPKETIRKFAFQHIAPVDSALMPALQHYLLDCCKRHGIDPIVISIIERPPAISQIAVMPPREREFYVLVRLAFPEFCYQGSAATVVRTDDYVRITPDRTRVVWLAKDSDGNVYLASNGGAITNVCHPDNLEYVRPVRANEILDIKLATGEIKNMGMEFQVPPERGSGNGNSSKSVFLPGIGFAPDTLHVLREGNGSLVPSEAKKKPFEGKERPKLPERLSSEFGVYGFEKSDIQRLLHYGDTGEYMAIGLGNAEPDAIFKRCTHLSALTSEHKAFIVSPGRDNRIEFSARMILRNGEGEPRFLRSPILVGSNMLGNTEEEQTILRTLAEKYGTLHVDELKHSARIQLSYSGQETLEHALQRITGEAEALARSGVNNIILDDATLCDEIPIPGSLACAVVHHSLLRKSMDTDSGPVNLRSCVNLIGKFKSIANAEELKECITNGADAVCPSMALDASMELFVEPLDGQVTSRRSELIQRGLNALVGMEQDLAIASGSSGFHDINAMRGNAPGMEYEVGIADDINALIGNLPGMRAGGVDLKTLDLFSRSRIAQFRRDAKMDRSGLADYEDKWERWGPGVKGIIDRMAIEGPSYKFDPKEYEDLPIVTQEDAVRITRLAEFKDFSDEELRMVDLRALDIVAVMVAHMSIGANNIETWLAILAALYEIRHEAQNGEIPFLNENETLVMAGIGEGGIAAEFRMFLAHIVGQYASGRFGLETNDGDIFDRDHLMKQGLLRIKGIQEGTFEENEISIIERLVANLVKSEHIEQDLKDLENGKLALLCRFILNINDKNAQDAKRGYGGMMMKTIMLIARIRGTTPHDPVKSFFNHPDGDSIEELRQRIFSVMREAAGEIPELGDIEAAIWSKDAMDPYAMANIFGEVKAGAVLIDHDWRGGTGNRPVGTKRASHPWLTEATRYDALDSSMLGMMVYRFMSSNPTPVDAMKSIELGGIDGTLLATGLLRAMKCVIGTCRECNTGLCPPVLTDQREARRDKLYEFDPDAPENPLSSKVDAKTQKERAKRFILAFIRTMKVLLKNQGFKNITEAKRQRDRLEIIDHVEVEGAEWIRAVTNHPYSQEDVERACNVTDRFAFGKFIRGEDFPAEQITRTLRRYLDLEGEIPNELASQNAFLVAGDIANIFPRLSRADRQVYGQFLDGSILKLEDTFRTFLREHGKKVPSQFTKDAFLARYQRMDFQADRDEQEFLERLITAYRIRELTQKFRDDEDEHNYQDQFFARTVHTNGKYSIKSPRAIVSQENGFTIDRYRGAARKIANVVLEHIKIKTSKEPLVIEIDDVMTDRDMGIATCLNALYHHFTEEFSRTVESIEIRLKKGIAGHNLGAMVNGNYLFGEEHGKSKLRIVVGSPEYPAHADGSVGMSANGATIIIHGYISDCGAACASDLNLSVRGSSVKLGVGSRGTTTIYNHEPLPDVIGVGATGNITIYSPVMRREGDDRRTAAKIGIAGDEQGFSKVVVRATLEEVTLSQMPGVGTFAKKLSRLDERQIQDVLGRNFLLYEGGKAPPFSVNRENHTKIVSEHYFRNLVTSFLVHNFYVTRKDFSFEEQIESAAGELLEMIGIDDRDPVNKSLMMKTVAILRDLQDRFQQDEQRHIVSAHDKAFLEARKKSLEFLKEFKKHPPQPDGPRSSGEELLAAA